MGNWTPGPWSVADNGIWDISVRAAGTVCHVNNKGDWFPKGDSISGRSQNQMLADAHLIAAAPVLLEELQNATVQMDMAAECIEAGRYDEALLHVRSMKRKRTAAIAKATGETK